MINLCLIGAGRMGQTHAKTIQQCPQANLYAVVDTNGDLAKQVAREHQAKAYSNAEDALQDSNIDAVLIVSKTDTHADLIIEAAKARKPIFCEKPIDLNLDKIDRALAAVTEYQVPLMVGFNRRFDPSFSTLQKKRLG